MEVTYNQFLSSPIQYRYGKGSCVYDFDDNHTLIEQHTGSASLEEDIFALDQDALAAPTTIGPVSTAGASNNAHFKTRLINITKDRELQANIEFANAAQDNYRLWLARV